MRSGSVRESLFWFSVRQIGEKLRSSTNMGDLNDLELIKLVEKTPCLFAKQTKQYKSVDKSAVWAQIGCLLTHKKTGADAMRRWDSLRTQWSREHKRKREYVPSGSGATRDSQEFQYYAEMSFLIPHYIPRPTRSNMNKSAGSSAVVHLDDAPIDVPSSCEKDNESTAATDTVVAVASSGLWSTDLLLGDPSQPSCSKQVSFDLPGTSSSPVKLSSSAQAALQVASSSSLGNVPTKKFKSKSACSEPTVPPPDNAAKKKKTDLDSKLDKSLGIMESFAKRVDTILDKKPEEQQLEPEIEAFMALIRVSLIKRVKPENQFACLTRVQEVINEFGNL